MKRIILATTNPNKLKEINSISLKYGIQFENIDKDFNPTEDGETFEENSYIKAKEASKLTNCYSLADDTGLCVEALNGRPGIYSARYAPTQKEKIEKLLNELKDTPQDKRNAKFVCTMVLCNKNGEKIHTELGEIEGYITNEAKGINGFGYDPIFFVKDLNKTMAEMTDDEKNTYSHRAKALTKMLEYINTKLKD